MRADHRGRAPLCQFFHGRSQKAISGKPRRVHRGRGFVWPLYKKQLPRASTRLRIRRFSCHPAPPRTHIRGMSEAAHKVFIVPCRTQKGFFLFTNGSDPNFLMEDVPADYVGLCSDALNHMVQTSGQTPLVLGAEMGQTLAFGPCQFSLEKSRGGALNYARECRVGACQGSSIVRMSLVGEMRQTTQGDARPLTTGALPPSTPEVCPVCLAAVGGESQWRNPQESDIPTPFTHYMCYGCWEEVARHDQRCPLCRTDVAAWIRRHLFERGPDPAVDCVIPNLTPESLRSFAQAMESAEGAGTQEARMALLIQAFASHAHGENRENRHDASLMWQP